VPVVETTWISDDVPVSLSDEPSLCLDADVSSGAVDDDFRPPKEEEDTDMPTIDREQLKTMLDNETPIRLIMAQGPGRYHAAHIPGSETFASLDEALDHLDVDDHM